MAATLRGYPSPALKRGTFRRFLRKFYLSRITSCVHRLHELSLFYTCWDAWSQERLHPKRLLLYCGNGLSSVNRYFFIGCLTCRESIYAVSGKELCMPSQKYLRSLYGPAAAFSE
jgi:hypothetical protein